MYGRANMVMMRGFRMDPSITKQKLKPGTIRRIAGYARPYRVHLAIFLLATAVDAVVTVVNPLLLRAIIDQGILPRNERVVIVIACAVAAVAIFDAVLGFVIRWFSARIGEGLIYDLRTQVFDHVQRQPIAFFTRAQTGSLVSRLDGDVVGAQQAITSTLSGVLSNLLSLILILVTLFYLSWLVTVIALVMIPLFILPARLVGRRMQRLTRESMQLNAEMGSTMTERFNVAGAMLVKLFGRPREESSAFSSRAAKVRDIGVVTAMYGQVLFVALTLLASLVTALVYGLGGTLVINGTFQIGTLVALTTLLGRVYGPITSLSSVQISVMTALVSFDRVFEVLDLKPLIAEKPGAVPLPRPTGAGAHDALAPEIEFEDVSFRYPSASEVSLASLESIALPAPERRDATAGVLHEVSFRAPAGQADRPGRPLGSGQDHDHGAGRAALRPEPGSRKDRRLRRQGRHPGVIARRGGRGHPGRAPVPRHDPGQPDLRAARGHRARADPGMRGRPDLGLDLQPARRPGHRGGGPGLPAFRR